MCRSNICLTWTAVDFNLAPPTYFRRPSYYVYPLWRTAGDALVANSHNLDEYVELAVYATHHSSNDALTLLVVNKTEALSGTVLLQDFKPNGKVEVFVAEGESLQDTAVAYNGDENAPLDLDISPITMTITEPEFAYTFPPYSVTSMTIYGEVLPPPPPPPIEVYLPFVAVTTGEGAR